MRRIRSQKLLSFPEILDLPVMFVWIAAVKSTKRVGFCAFDVVFMLLKNI